MSQSTRASWLRSARRAIRIKDLSEQIQRNQRRHSSLLNDAVHQADRQMRHLRAAQDRRARRKTVRARRDTAGVLRQFGSGTGPPDTNS